MKIKFFDTLKKMSIQKVDYILTLMLEIILSVVVFDLFGGLLIAGILDDNELMIDFVCHFFMCAYVGGLQVYVFKKFSCDSGSFSHDGTILFLTVTAILNFFLSYVALERLKCGYYTGICCVVVISIIAIIIAFDLFRFIEKWRRK